MSTIVLKTNEWQNHHSNYLIFIKVGVFFVHFHWFVNFT